MKRVGKTLKRFWPLYLMFLPGAVYLFINCYIPMFGIQIACQQTFVALGNAKYSLFLALLRKVFLLIPLIYIMPALFPADKTIAIFAAEPIADFLAVVVTASLFTWQFRKVLREMRSGSIKRDTDGPSPITAG